MPLVLQSILSVILLYEFNSIFTLFILSFLFIFQYSKSQNKWVLIIIFILSVSFVRNQTLIPKPNFDHHFTVIKTKNNFVTFKQGLYTYSGFVDSNLESGQRVKIEGTFEPQTSNDFFDLLRMKGNFHGLSIDSIEISSKNSLLTKFYEITENNTLIRKVLFSETVEIESNWVTLLTSSGVLLSTFVLELRKNLNLIFDEKKQSYFITVLLVGLLLFVGFQFIIVRLLLKEILSFSKLKNPKRNLIEMLIILILFPFSYTQLAFLIPYSYKLSKFLYYDQKFIRLKQSITLIVIQLMVLFEASLIQTILFSYFRIISKILIYLSLIPFLNLNWILFNLDKLVMNFSFLDIKITGQMHYVFGFLIVLTMILQRTTIKEYLFIGLCFTVYTLVLNYNPSAQVIFLNVKQGDSTLFIAPYQKEIVLLDTGKQSEQQGLDRALKKFGITEIDTIILSHLDNDHSGNVDFLKQNYSVKNIIQSKSDVILDSYFKFQFYLKEFEFEDENENSLIVSTTINSKTFLFLGDISKAVERKLIMENSNLTSDVVKLAHHGSNTSSDEYFLNKLNPDFVIISSDPSAYGHPHFETLETLRKRNLKSLQTYEHNHIQFVLFSNINFIITKAQIIQLK